MLATAARAATVRQPTGQTVRCLLLDAVSSAKWDSRHSKSSAARNERCGKPQAVHAALPVHTMLQGRAPFKIPKQLPPSSIQLMVQGKCKGTHCVAWSTRPSAVLSIIALIHAAFSSRCCNP